MVRSYRGKKTLSALAVSLIAPIFMMPSVYAGPQANVNFNINVAEIITVTLKEPASWAIGGTSTLLRNKINVEATTNSPIGVTVSMWAGPTTNLEHTTAYSSSDTSSYIETLAADTTASAFPVNRWGYSVNDTVAGNNSATYSALKTSTDAIQLFTTVGTSSVGGSNKDVYFAAKADGDKQSGTYSQEVYFAAVSGTIDTDNPRVPVNPAGPNSDTSVAHYDAPRTVTTHTTRSTSGSGTSSVSGATNNTTTEVVTGDVASYYAHAAGVETSTDPASTTTTGTDSMLPTVLGATAGIATISGAGLYAFSRRKLK